MAKHTMLRFDCTPQLYISSESTFVETRAVATTMAEFIRLVASNVHTDAQRAEMLAVLFESRAGKTMLRKLEANLGLALAPVEMVQ